LCPYTFLEKLKVQSFVSVFPLQERFLNCGATETAARMGFMPIWAEGIQHTFYATWVFFRQFAGTCTTRTLDLVRAVAGKMVKTLAIKAAFGDFSKFGYFRTGILHINP